jgi:hypothetical protein
MFWVGFEQIVFSFIPSVKLEHLKYEMLEIIHKSKIRNTKNKGNVIKKKEMLKNIPT